MLFAQWLCGALALQTALTNESATDTGSGAPAAPTTPGEALEALRGESRWSAHELPLAMDSKIDLDGKLSIQQEPPPERAIYPGSFQGMEYDLTVHGDLEVGEGFHRKGRVPSFVARLRAAYDAEADKALLYDAQGTAFGAIRFVDHDRKLRLSYDKGETSYGAGNDKGGFDDFTFREARYGGAAILVDSGGKDAYHLELFKYYDGEFHSGILFTKCSAHVACDPVHSTSDDLQSWTTATREQRDSFCATPQTIEPPKIPAGSPVKMRRKHSTEWQYGRVVKYDCKMPRIKYNTPVEHYGAMLTWDPEYGTYSWDDDYDVEVTDGFEELYRVGEYRLALATPSSEGVVQPSTLRVKRATDEDHAAFPLAVSRLGEKQALPQQQTPVDAAGEAAASAAVAVVAQVDFPRPADHAHHLYTLELGAEPEWPGDWTTTQLYFKTSDLCGAGAFSQPALQCTAVTQADVLLARARLATSLVPQRAFGVELELLARTPSAEQKRFLSKHMIQELLYYGDAWNGTSVQDLQSSQRKAVRSEYQGLTDSQRQQMENRLDGMKGIEACFRQAKRGHDDASCESHGDCGLSHFCAKSKSCKPRNTCGEGSGEAAESIDGVCPMLISKWAWTYDSSVQPMTRAQARELLGPEASDEAVDGETTGVPFELVSAPPPHALAGPRGFEHTAEVLGLMHYMGMQAGPKLGLHVHVNVGKPGQPTDGDRVAEMGRDLTVAEISNVWAQYARFQPVITEMLQDNRAANHYCKGLYFNQVITSSPYEDMTTQVESEANGFQVKNFERMHEWLNGRDGGLLAPSASSPRDDKKFCNFVLTGEERDYGPCNSRWPKERYYQLNLAVLNKYGTMEFRGFPATHDSERALAWIQFVLKFVEHYSTVREDEGDFFGESTAAAGLKKLQMMQAASNFEKLEAELGISLDYFKRRPWVEGYSCSTRNKVSDERKKEYAADKPVYFDEKSEPVVALAAATNEPDSANNPDHKTALVEESAAGEAEPVSVRRHRVEARPDGQVQF